LLVTHPPPTPHPSYPISQAAFNEDYTEDLWHGFQFLAYNFLEDYRAGNNGRTMDNVWPDWGFDWSNVRLAGHVDQSQSMILN